MWIWLNLLLKTTTSALLFSSFHYHALFFLIHPIYTSKLFFVIFSIFNFPAFCHLDLKPLFDYPLAVISFFFSSFFYDHYQLQPLTLIAGVHFTTNIRWDYSNLFLAVVSCTAHKRKPSFVTASLTCTRLQSRSGRAQARQKADSKTADFIYFFFLKRWCTTVCC